MIRIFFLLFAIQISSLAFSNVRIEQTQINGMNVSPSALCNVSLFNDGENAEISLCIQIKDLSGIRLMEFYTLPFLINSGFHSTSELGIVPLNPVYENSPVARYIMTNQMLPKGKFMYCCRVVQKNNGEWNDAYCEEISSGMNFFMELVYPGNADSIFEQRPDFHWLHSGDLGLLSDAEYFRLICTELKDDRIPSEAIQNEVPLFVKDRLNTQQLSFPFDLPPLDKGKTYAWEVQKIAENQIISRTEAWKFSIIGDKPPDYDKYVSLSKSINGSFYTARENKIFFRFDENYSSGKMECEIYNENRELLKGLPDNESIALKNNRKLKSSGYNCFEMDLDSFNLKMGYYILEVKNEKQENFKLKFYVP